MSDLKEAEMQTWERFIRPGADNCGRAHEMLLEAFAELRRHRAAMNRLEAWAAELDNYTTGRFIALELRNRIKGDADE